MEKKMKFFILFFGTFCLVNSALTQGFNSPHGINDPNVFHNQFRRQLSTQQHILTDVQQHHTQPRQASQQQFFLQQSPSIEVPITQQQQQRNRFPATNNVRQNGFQQQNNQFQRSAQSQLQTQQQPQSQPNLDLHTQNFLTLRNYANQQVGPQQSLPQRSFSNKPFQSLPPQQQPQPQQQYSTLPANVFQQQGQSNFAQALPQTQQKLPSQGPGPAFQAQQQKPFSALPPFNFQQQSQQSQQQQHLPLKQQQQNFQVTPNLGLPVPQIFPHLQSTAFPPQQQQQQLQFPTQQQQQFNNQLQQPQQPFSSIPTPLAQTADQEYKQKLIQKHEQFVQKQYEKSQNKVRQQHEEFVAKQQTIKQQVLPTLIGSQQQYLQTNYNPQRSRPVSSAELPSFSSSLQQYYQEHPTTTTTTTTTTTEATSTPGKPTKDIYAQVKAELGKYGQKTSVNSKKPVKTIPRDELLKQLKAALAEAPQKELGNKTYDEMDLVLPNGQRVQVIRTTDPNLVQGQQGYTQDQLQALLGQQGSQLSLSDVAPEKSKDLVLPNGSKVQILRSPDPQESVDPQSLPGGVDLSNLASLYGGDISGISNGANSIASSAVISSDSDEPPTLEELAKRGLIPDGYEIEGLSSNPPQPKPAPTLPPKKKATYVYLEEQADGSFKIQGVKANGEKETKQTGAEVESILDRIRNGEIKLPPSVQRLTLPNDEVVEIQGGNIIKTTAAPKTTISTTAAPLIKTTPFESIRTTAQRQTYHTTRTTATPPSIQRSSHSHSQDTTYHTTATPIYTASASASPVVTYGTSTHVPITESLTVSEQHHYSDALVQESEHKEKASEVETSSTGNPSEDLIQILKKNELFAMAKYLRQSGLDSILNETGPYTIFVPTDKAFKNLLVQLGGPERAEEKFKANPRLLSGLLLHHVIPGAFEIATLQDEMTGVSLAGTQLRVNQYTMHDQEWNDVTLTTINGAMVVLNKKDIKIPQGIAHAVDRVMFPLPVGDLLQTLQSDRENRFTTFLKILYTSGLSEKLQSKGVKTYSVFAPTDKSFGEVESDILEKLYNDKEAAEEFAMKHIVPGTLFSAGMRFYQVKDSLLTGKTVILQKTSAGKIKVNDAQMVTSNIPATNGVIHAIDGVLA